MITKVLQRFLSVGILLAGVGVLSVLAEEIPLPDGYVQLEWIRSTSGGQQYIDTKYMPLASDIVTCVADVEKVQNSASLYATIFGSRVDNKNHSLLFFTHVGSASGSFPYYYRNTTTVSGSKGSFPCGCKTVLRCDGQSAKWWAVDAPDTTWELKCTATDDCGNNLYIFTENAGPANGSNLLPNTWNTMKLYSFSIEHFGGDKVRDFVPCRAVNGKCGLWDKVTGEFYPNANTTGTEDFHGSDDVPVFVSYIKSTSGGQQWINTGYTPLAGDTLTCVLDVDKKQLSSNYYATPFGARKGNSSNAYTFFSHTGTYNNDKPSYLRDSHITTGEASTFTCGKRTMLFCDASSASWWPLDRSSPSVTLNIATATVDCSAPMFIFTLNQGADGALNPLGASTWCVMKLYSFIMESGGTTVCHLLPYRTTVGKLGVYDIANPSGGAEAIHLNQGTTGVDFEWGGVAYTREDNGTTIVLREGVLSDFDLEGYSQVKVATFMSVNATAVTNYPALALERGKFALQDGVTLDYHVANTFALSGGAVLAIDLTESANDRFAAGTVDLSGASIDNPVEIEITASGIASLASDAARPLITAEGLVASDAAKFVVKGFPAEVAFVDGAFVLRGREPEDVVWSGADANSTAWSSGANWVGEAVPPSGAAVVFNLAAGGTTTFDLAEHLAKGVRIGLEAGAFTHGGEARLSLMSFITNLSASAQTFSVPLSLGVVGQPFDIYTDGPLSLTGDVTTSGTFVRKLGSGLLALDDTAVAQAHDVELAAGVTRIRPSGRSMVAGSTGELSIKSGAQLEIDMDGSSELMRESIHSKTLVLAGDGPDHEGALVNSTEGTSEFGLSLISHLKLAADATIGSRSTRDARIDISTLSGSATNEIAVEGPYTLTTTPGFMLCFIGARFALDRIVSRGSLAFCDTLTGVITNGVHLTGDTRLTWWRAKIPAGIPFAIDEGTCVFTSNGASTHNGSLTVAADATIALSNTVQVICAGAVTNNGAIMRTTQGAALFSGPLHGSGRLEGSDIKMSTTGCWYLTHGDTGWTERMDVASAVDFLPSVRQIEVTVNDSVFPLEPLVISPCGGLTSAQVAQAIGLTVRDGAGEVIPNCWLDVVGGNLVLHLADANLVRYAVWTGRSVDAPNDFSNAANWLCSNDVNEVISGGLPTNQTTVIIAGSECNFNFPVGASLICRGISFADAVKLGADCDWRGLDAELTGTIDLFGHKLFVSDLKGTATITDTTVCYQPVEYIQSSGGQYINTGYTPKASDVVVCVVDVDNTQSSAYTYASIFGARKDNKTNSFTFFSHTSGSKANKPSYLRNSLIVTGSASSFICGKKTRLECNATSAIWYALDNPEAPKTLELGISATDDCAGPMFIFTINQGTGDVLSPIGGTTWEKMKLYSFQIFDKDGNLKRDFIPVKKMPSGEGALWDRVTNQPFENAGSGSFSVGTATESVQAGELHFDVPSGTKTHSEVLLAGSMRLVKDGAGTLILSMQNQTYNGGTDVTAGTVTLGATGLKRVYGAAGNTVWVRTNATFNVQSYPNHCDYTFVLDGGMLAGSAALNNGYDWFQHIVLTADSCMTGKNFGLLGPSWAETTLETNGHVLSIEVAEQSQEFFMANLTVTGGGRIVGNGGGWLVLGGNHSNGGKFVHAETTTLEVTNIATMCSSTDVHFAGYVANYQGGDTDTNTGLITVTERFTPGSDSATWYDTILMDGVTTDLSHLTQTLNTACTYGNSGSTRTVKFADGGTILVELGARHMRSGAEVISWTPENAPDDSVVFKLAPGQKGYLLRTTTGVEYHKGFLVILR